TVGRGDVEDTVLATGELQPIQLVSAGAQVSGRVVSLMVGLGDHVAKGQVIATIDPVPATNQLKTAEAALAQMVAQRAGQAATLAQDQIQLKRHGITLAAQASSQSDYDTAVATEKAAKASLDALDAEIAQAKVSVDTAKVNLGYTNVVSPIDGDVLAVVTKQGQTVNAVQAAPTIVILGDMSTMTAKAQISEADVIKVKPGLGAYFTILGDSKRKFYGKLRSVAPAPDSIVSEVVNNTAASTSTTQAIYYDGLVDVPNPDRVLKADMTAQVTIQVAAVHDVVTVPSSALDPAPPQGPQRPSFAGRPPGGTPGPMMFHRAPDQHMVLVVNAKGQPEPRMVRIGLDNKVTAQVLSGLEPGEKVVVGQASSTPTLQPGQPGGPPGGPPRGAVVMRGP
ncbi:MAG TPA: efflux RND transporter periplasmic adaptor subunit, partial [Caulobacteraceae bacterium]|nr:efflux RND transporter periplasmic adaptor subunit [Caulobacteraceae bacterium]